MINSVHNEVKFVGIRTDGVTGGSSPLSICYIYVCLFVQTFQNN